MYFDLNRLGCIVTKQLLGAMEAYQPQRIHLLRLSHFPDLSSTLTTIVSASATSTLAFHPPTISSSQ